MQQSLVTKTIEDLPKRHVHYPRGAFPVFYDDDGKGALCACMRSAVENYLKLRKQAHPDEIKLDVWNFPETFIESLKNDFATDSITEIEDWYALMPFEENLCHRCHKKKPKTKFCPESEGTVFRQNYGWYLDMKHYEYGVVPRVLRYLKDIQSDQIKKLIDYKYISLKEDLMYDSAIENLPVESVELWLSDHDEIWESGAPRIWDPQFPYNFTESLKRELTRKNSAIRRFIEDSVRADFDYQPLIGKWKSEQKLYEIIKKIVPKAKIKRHFRPRILEHLELDIYLPDYNIGIEYQGIQHYEPVAHWGGKTGLRKVQERDARKKELCEVAGITIIYFYHYEVLTPDLIYRKIKPHIAEAIMKR